MAFDWWQEWRPLEFEFMVCICMHGYILLLYYSTILLLFYNCHLLELVVCICMHRCTLIFHCSTKLYYYTTLLLLVYYTVLLFYCLTFLLSLFYCSTILQSNVTKLSRIINCIIMCKYCSYYLVSACGNFLWKMWCMSGISSPILCFNSMCQ